MTNMAAVALGKGATAVAGLLTIMVLTRELGPREFGYYRTVLTYSAFAAVLADLGIYLVGLREMSRPGADAARVVGNALFLRLTSTAAILLVASLLALLLPYDATVDRGIFLGALIYTAIQGSEFLVAVFQRALKQAGHAIAEATGAFATLTGVWLLSLLNADALGMLCATLFGATTALTVSWTLARRLVPFRPRFERSVWRQYIVAGLPIAGSHILSMAMLRGDSLLLSIFKPAADIGLYGVPTKMFELTTSLPYLFGGLMMPLMTAAAARAAMNGTIAATAAGNPDEFARLLARSLDAMFMFGVGVVLTLSLFAPQILAFISGAEFAAGAPALVILAFAALLTALSIVLRFALIALDRPKAVLLADAAACSVALVAYFTLIPRFSLIGAAAGTAIAEASVLCGMLFGLRRAGRAWPRCSGAPKTLMGGTAAAGAIWLMSHMGIPWGLCLAAGGMIYLLLLALTGAIPRDLLVSLLRRSRAGDA
jgi:O-antigen/teichoic acid export membrane protein